MTAFVWSRYRFLTWMINRSVLCVHIHSTINNRSIILTWFLMIMLLLFIFFSGFWMAKAFWLLSPRFCDAEFVCEKIVPYVTKYEYLFACRKITILFRLSYKRYFVWNKTYLLRRTRNYYNIYANDTILRHNHRES